MLTVHLQGEEGGDGRVLQEVHSTCVVAGVADGNVSDLELPDDTLAAVVSDGFQQ